MTNIIEFVNPRIIYPDFTGTGMYNKYKRPLFNIIVTPEEASLMEASGLKIRWTKPSQRFPDPEPYVEIAIGFSFMAADGTIQPATNPPTITITNRATNETFVITEDKLDILAASQLSNISLAVTQSKPKLLPTGALRSNFYLRTLTADIMPFYTRQ